MRSAQKTKKLPLRFILDFYDAYLRESELGKVAAALEITGPGLTYRINNHPELAEAKELADKRRGKTNSFSGYVFQRLSPKGKEVWDQIQFWDNHESAYNKIESILAGQTKQLRQELFIHALVSHSFDLSSACRMVGITRHMLAGWSKELAFQQLIEEIQWHKKNFFETSLVNLVEEGHPGAVIFVNKTVNADRGYAEKMEVKHTGNIETSFTIDDLELSVETRIELLNAIRKRKEIEEPIEVKQLKNS